MEGKKTYKDVKGEKKKKQRKEREGSVFKREACNFVRRNE